jgi:ABC-2 type transport system permease protein
VTRLLTKIWAFLVRDFLSDVSYRFAFVLQLGGMFFAVAVFFYGSRMIDPKTAGLNGVEPFPWLLVGIAFQLYFSTALYSFAAKVRGEQVLGTLEAMLVSPTPTSVVIFSSTAWDFTWGGVRLLVYLLCAVFIFGVKLNVVSPAALVLGVALTLLSSAGIGMLSASFILYFKRGDPINFLLTMGTTFFGNVIFPSKLLPGPVQWVSDWLPMSWSLQVVRGALLAGNSFGEVARPIGRLAILTAVLVPMGLLGARIAIRKAKREGSLIQY